jgi:hypothetical protein
MGLDMPDNKDLVPVNSINKVDVSPVLREVVEYAKDQNALGDLETLISKVPKKDSMDWKLISGVLCNSIIEWVANNKDKEVEPVELIHHIQKDIGYLLKRLGLTM